MPIRKELYPENWRAISLSIRRDRAKNRCEWCSAVNGEPHPVTGSRVVLTVAHLDRNPANNAESNLAALCQRCHLNYDRPVNLPKVLEKLRLHRLAKLAAQEAAGQQKLWEAS